MKKSFKYISLFPIIVYPYELYNIGIFEHHENNKNYSFGLLFL